MANYFAQLQPFQVNANPINLAPVNNALDTINQQQNIQKQFGLQQQASDRADQELALNKQTTASALKTQAANYEDLTHRILASTAQGALSLQDPNARSAIANGIVSGHPEMAANLTKYGVDPKNPDGVLNFFANYGQNPLDAQLKKAQIGQAQTATAAARAPQPTIIGTDVFGSKYANRNPLTGELTPLDPKLTGGSVGNEMVSNLADGIQTGKQPPVITQGAGTTGKINAAVRSELQHRGFDLTSAALQYEAAHKQVLSLNAPQMVRYTGLAQSVVNTIDRVKELSASMNNSGLTGLNAAKLAALVNTAGNTEQGKLASQYLASVNTLKEEFASLAQGGYAPTEAAWDLANKQINANFGVEQLPATLNEIQRLIRYRLDAIPNIHTLGPGASNPYVNGGVAPQVGHGAQPAIAAPGALPATAAPPAVAPGVTHVWDPTNGLRAVGGQ